MTYSFTTFELELVVDPRHDFSGYLFYENMQSALDHTLLCESAVLVKGKSFVILYTYFSFKHLMENP